MTPYTPNSNQPLEWQQPSAHRNKKTGAAGHAATHSPSQKVLKDAATSPSPVPHTPAPPVQTVITPLSHNDLTLSSPTATTHAARKKLFGNLTLSFIISLLLIAAGGVIAGSIVIWQYIRPPEAMFTAPPPQPQLPARELHHQIRFKQFEKQTRKPQVMSKLVSQAPSALALPELPPMTFDPNAVRSAQEMLPPVGGTLGDLGLAAMGLGDASDAAFAASADTEFFGMRIQTRAIVILVDLSYLLSQQGLQEEFIKETQTMVEKFHPDTAFNIILYLDYAAPYAENLVFATRAQKNALATYLQGITRTTSQNPDTRGSTPYHALRYALEMNPDTIVMLVADDLPWRAQSSDPTDVIRRASNVGNRRLHAQEILDMLQRDRNRRSQERIDSVPINVISYKPRRQTAQQEEAQEFYQNISRRSGGRFRRID